jgi:hypothetical protein
MHKIKKLKKISQDPNLASKPLGVVIVLDLKICGAVLPLPNVFMLCA